MWHIKFIIYCIWLTLLPFFSEKMLFFLSLTKKKKNLQFCNPDYVNIFMISCGHYKWLFLQICHNLSCVQSCASLFKDFNEDLSQIVLKNEKLAHILTILFDHSFCKYKSCISEIGFGLRILYFVVFKMSKYYGQAF